MTALSIVQGSVWPAVRNRRYHSCLIRRRSEPPAASTTRSGFVVPSTTWMFAWRRVIHAVATAIEVTTYFAASRSSSAFSSG